MWSNLDHQVWNSLKSHGLESHAVYLLAVSGGLDSMVLTDVFKNIRPQAKIILMHYHHGPGDHSKYRDEALALIQNQKECSFELGQSEIELKSESEFREARLSFFEKIKRKYQTHYYITAHHQDDVLETRLLKLIRGAGTDSLAAFEIWNDLIFRPFFEISKSDLKDYAIEKKITWLDDPSNSESQYLRNWVRNVWLPALEAKTRGGVKTLAQSLQNILNSAEQNQNGTLTESARYVMAHDGQISIDRLWFFGLNTKDQLNVLVRAIRGSFLVDFSLGQLKEVVRRLDKNQNDHIFQVAGINWVINAHTIVLSYKQNIN